MNETNRVGEKKLRVLLLLSETWNDNWAPNNNMTNWFSDFQDIEIATVSGSGNMPCNKICKDYFLIGEGQMLKSLINGRPVGKAYHFENYPQAPKAAELSEKRKKIGFGECARLARDIVWRFGRIDRNELRKFIDEFDPDVIFSQRKGSIKMCRIERIVSKMTPAPMIAYTGDDEYSFGQFSLSPIFWLRRLWLRRTLNKNIKMYKLFYSQSERQMREFEKKFKVPTKFLVKCGSFDEEKIHRTVNSPIQLVYAGKLYCNRWKTLAMMADAVKNINEQTGNKKIVLNIYTRDAVTKKQDKLLNDGINSIIHGGVSAEELTRVYHRSDVALHIEGFDLKNRLLTKDSFSTKVMDCLSSGCAVLAVCADIHAAGQYLRAQDAAMVASSAKEISEILERISDDPRTVTKYAEKAYLCGVKNHERKNIQAMLRADLENALR